MADQMQETIYELVTAPGIDLTQLDRTLLRPSPDVQGTTMDGETVLLDLSSGRYYTLNRLGSVIWEQCMGRQTLAQSMPCCASGSRWALNKRLTIWWPWPRS